MLRRIKGYRRPVCLLSCLLCLSMAQPALAESKVKVDVVVPKTNIGVRVPLTLPTLDKAFLLKASRIAAAVALVSALVKKLSPPKGKVAPVKGKEANRMSITAVQKWAVAGDMRAQFVMGHVCWSGLGQPQNRVEAIHWWQRAAAQGHEGAVAVLRQTGKGTVPKTKLGPLLCAVGTEASQNRYRKRQPGEAVKWWQLAYRLHDRRSAALLGTACFTGYDGMKKDEKRAAELLLEGVRDRDPLAQYELGRAYLSGRGVKKDPELALGLLHEAAKQGMSGAAVLEDKILTNEIH